MIIAFNNLLLTINMGYILNIGFAGFFFYSSFIGRLDRQIPSQLFTNNNKMLN